jgi:hypothetical protein
MFERMWGCARVTASFNNPTVSQLKRKSGWALSDIVRGLVNQVYMLPYYSHITSAMTTRDTEVIYQIPPPPHC